MPDLSLDQEVLSPSQSTEGDFSIVSDAPAVPITQEALQERSKKYDYALGGRSPGREVLASEIQNGMETTRRQILKQEQAQKAQAAREEAVKQYIEKRPPGMPLDPREVDVLFSREAAPASVSDADVSIEREYAKQVMLTAMNETDMDRSNLKSVLERNGVKTERDRSIAENVIAAKEGFQKLFEEKEAEVKNSSWASYLGDTALGFIPFYTWYARTNVVKGANADAWAPGGNLRQQVEELYRIASTDPEKAVSEARAAVNRIAAYSTHEAKDFANRLMAFASTDENIMNLFGAVEVATLPGTPSLVRGGARVTNAISGAAIGAVKASGGRTMSALGLLDTTGQVERAALQQVTDRLRGLADNTSSAFQNIEQTVPSVFNPGAVLQNTQFLSRELAQRLERELTGQSADLLRAATAAAQDGRLTDAVLQEGLANTMRLMRQQYRHLNDSIINVRAIPAQDTVANVDHIGIQLGKQDATLFPSEAAAQKAATDTYLLKDFSIGQQGKGYYIEISKPVDETATSVRNALQVQTDHTTPRSLLNTFISGLRSPDHLLSEKTVRDMTTTVFGSTELQSALARAVDNSLGGMKRWRRDSLERFQNFMSAERDYINPVTRERGRFATSQTEFETRWNQQFNRAPSFEETKAYWSYVQLSDFDLVVRNIALLRDKQRMGLEMFTLPYKPNVAIPGSIMKDGKLQQTANDIRFQAADNESQTLPALEGKFTTTLPWHINQNANILVWDGTHPNIIQSRFASATERANLDALSQTDNWKIIHLSPTGQRALREHPTFNGIHADYILTRSAETSQLPMQQIPRRPGGHVEYRDGYFIRQPDIVRSSGRFDQTMYMGDNNFFHFTTQQHADQYAEILNRARLVFNDDVALGNLINNELPHVFNSVNDFRRQWHAAGLNPDIPLFVSRKGQSLDTTGALETLRRSPQEEFTKLSDSPHNLYGGGGVSFKYLGERGEQLNTVIDGHPVNASMLDPVSTMIRANNTLMRAKHLDELKIKSSEHFIAEFSHLLEGTLSDIRAFPMKALLEPVWKKNADTMELAAAKAYRRSVVSLLGERSEIEKAADFAKQRIAENAFNSMGERGYRIATSIMDIALLKDPIQFARSVAFTAKMGFFNLAQFPLQAQTFFHIAAIEGPARATSSMGVGMMMRSLALTNRQNIMDYIGNRAAIFGWSREQFLESWQLMRESGFARVGREHANLGDFIQESPLRGKLGTFLDMGTKPYREGETLVRFTAWNSAYAEFRAANPTRAIRNEDRVTILQRANDLSNNMTVASDAAIQKSTLGALPTQFLSYQARMTENLITALTGSATARLSRGEAVRSIVAQSALYGVPVGLGAVTGVWPIYEFWKKHLLDKGVHYDIENSSLGTVLSDGIMAYLSELGTGTRFNVGERYGTAGTSIFRDILVGSDEDRLKAITGVSGTVARDFFKAAYPMVTGLLNYGDSSYKFKAQDMIDATSGISGINNAVKLWYALNYQKYITKNQSVLTNVTDREAIISYLTGLMPMDLADTYKILENDEYRKEAQKISTENFLKNFRLALQSFDKDELEQGADFHRRAMVHLEGGGFTPQEKNKLIADALKGGETVAERVILKYSRRDEKKFNAAVEMFKRRGLIEKD